MERNKIIAVAALAVGIVALRTGAMQQEQLITLVTGDGKETLIEKKRALLFGTVRDFLADIK